jgi:pSer/pThr/pTyr-binding forkhead associated (FHA) protein
MLEILGRDSNNSKGVHVVNMQNKNIIKLGRGHDIDVRITDISVSRVHAMIKLEKGNFYLEDNDSKFGTLALIRHPFLVNDAVNNVAL